jgi:uncharacterized protein (DUF1810 family)
MSAPSFDLDRFKLALDRHGGFAQAMSELRAGRKTGHWIWWVFPQIAGLGTSPTSRLYALQGREEAHAYLAGDVLRSRPIEVVATVREQVVGPVRRRLDGLKGSEIDTLKLVSSMTLFAEVARDPEVRALSGVEELGRMCEEILSVARGAGYPACDVTRAAL